MMLQPLGGGRSNFSLTHNFGEVVAQLNLAEKNVAAAREPAMKAVGTAVLGWGFQDFRAKSKGETAGGTTWKPITDAAIWSRVRHLTSYQNTIPKARALYSQPPMPEELLKRLPKGKGRYLQAVRGAIIKKYMEQHPEYAKAVRDFQKKRQTIRNQRQKMFDRFAAARKIGVDTGRLANSLVFGKPGNLFTVSSASVTVGASAIDTKTGKDYAVYFDEDRKIFGDGFITQERQEKLEGIVNRIFEKVIKQGFNEGNSSL